MRWRACVSCRAWPAIALDTEFVRTRTYYPQLGLIQLFDGANVAPDRSAFGISDWSPLKTVRDTRSQVLARGWRRSGSISVRLANCRSLIDTCKFWRRFAGVAVVGVLRRW